jgi:hypothetical protein
MRRPLERPHPVKLGKKREMAFAAQRSDLDNQKYSEIVRFYLNFNNSVNDTLKTVRVICDEWYLLFE